MRRWGGRTVLWAAAAVLAVSVTARAADDAADRFASILATAKKNRATPAGAAYDEAFGRSMQAQLGMQMARCFTRTPNPDLAKFDMLVRLDAQGKSSEVLVRPETNVALCFKPRIGEATFPEPPQPSYWVHVEMEVTR